MRTALRNYLPAVVCAIIPILCYFLIRPYAEINNSDDWAYIWDARKVALTGHISYSGWESPMLGWQLFYGAFFIKLFGFSFTAIRLTTLIEAVVVAFLLQRSFVRAGLNSRNAVLAAMIFILSPLYLKLTYTYHTDVAGVLCIVVCLYMCLRACQAKSEHSAIVWISLAALVNAVGGTARQISWLGVLVMVPCTLYGGTGNNTIEGGTGNATISGGGGDDVLSAGGDDSWLMYYSSQNMTLTNNTFSTSGGGYPASVSTINGFENAILAAGPGDFTLDASKFSGGTLLLGGTGDDTLMGSSSDDTLVGGAGNDSLVGGGGNDTFAFNSGSSGNQTVVEPEGTNIATLDFSNAPAGISIDLGQTGPQTVIPGVLTLSLSNPMGISNVLGSPYDDTIIGNARDNTLLGGGGEDLIAGLGGNDVLEGGITRVVLLDFDTDTTPGDHVYTPEERTEIENQLVADYSAFSYTFTLTPPLSGPYTTIYFNDPALTGLEGGSASSIDWRDLDIAGSTSLTADGLQVTPPDVASVNVANLLGQAGEPPATSADFVALSVTIAAHELGHLSGLEHGDSFGPIGSGIYSKVDPSLFHPDYTGPTDASETIDHIMASGASVDETLFQAIDDPFFGEREAIVLAYGEDGTPIIEQTTPHYSIADAQPVALEPLVVPDTDLEGVDADQSFDVTAADVVGYLGEDDGTSLTDYYSFTAQAGTLINLQVLSAVLNRPQGAFDTTLTVYDANGDVVAFNNDSFQDTDSTIIDLTLPTTGIYYVEVTSNSALARANRGRTSCSCTRSLPMGTRPPATRCMRARATTRSSAVRATTRSPPTCRLTPSFAGPALWTSWPTPRTSTFPRVPTRRSTRETPSH